MEGIKSSGFKSNISGIALDLFSALLFLFFIQQITFLVESIYMLNLLHTSMDSRALGILFLAIPILLFFVKHHKTTYAILVVSMLICMFLSPMLPTPMRIFSSGIGAGLFLFFLGLQLSDGDFPKINWGQSAALATLLSIFFRIAGHTLDISVTGNTKFVGWILVIIAAISFSQLIKAYTNQDPSLESGEDEEGVFSISLLKRRLFVAGIVGSVILIYLVFSSPGVISRWTESDYTMIHIILLTSILLSTFFGLKYILSIKRVRLILILWNSCFLFFFIWNILLHRISFPTLQDLSPVIVADGFTPYSLVNYIMLILSPVIFLNITYFAQVFKPGKPSKMAIPFTRSSILIILCVFMLIFTNTWGYVGSISKIFRNQFYLPFLIAGVFMIIPYFLSQSQAFNLEPGYFSRRLIKLIATICVIVSIGFILVRSQNKMDSSTDNIKKLTLMTYNIQQGVDFYGNKNFEGQLRLLEKINPDILCLQESDASRISGGNSDVVRYFAEHLGFYTFYGPKTVSGTYGTAILSRFPLDSCRTIFTYSNKDEIGTAVATISVGNKNIMLINSHPAGKEQAKHEHIDMVAALAKKNSMVIAMGDYNFRQDSPYYQKITNVLKDSWLSLYSNAIGPVDTEKLDLSFDNRNGSSGVLLKNGLLDMKNRIDHIFLSKDFKVEEAHYLPAPESETDHPAHWAVVRWE